MSARRNKRPRKYVAIRENWAAALSMLLPQEARDELRARKAPAKEVIALFTPDHNILHALGGADRWWNLTPMLRGPALKAKDNRDTSIVAKSDRLKAEHEDFRRRVLAPVKRPRRRDSAWPKGRKLQSRSSFERRP
jgi:hypothetical protein